MHAKIGRKKTCYPELAFSRELQLFEIYRVYADMFLDNVNLTETIVNLLFLFVFLYI